MSTTRILGIMTGTSCDGLDASLMEFRNGAFRSLGFRSVAFPSVLRREVLALQVPGARITLQSLLHLDRKLGEFHAQAVRRILPTFARAPHAISMHGQTVAHHPGAKGGGTTLQLGDPARVVAATGLTCIAQLRSGDLAAGGQGAPLAPLFHRELLRRAGLLNQGCAIHNLGGISNLTYVGKDGALLAFDTGPGNSWIDQAAQLATGGRQKFDSGGRLALRGRTDGVALKRLLNHPFLKLSPPKSTGRDDFPFQLLLKNSRSRKRLDLVALATRFTVVSVAQAYRKHILSRGLPLKRLFVAGGGAKNPVLMAGIQELLPEVRVEKMDVLGTPSQEVESQAFALFGFRALQGLPLGGSWTGVRGFGPPAHILPGQNFLALMRGLERD